MRPVLGIDLGTSNSVVALCQGGKVTIIADEEGNRIHPSAVAFLPDGSVLVGAKARAGLAQRPEQTVISAKRLIGRRHASREVAQTKQRMGYRIVDDQGGVALKIGGDVHTLETISALILRYLRDLAENFIGHSVRHAVITVPAYFDDNQRQATRRAGQMVGLEVLRIVNEPTAAAFSYGYGGKRSHRIAVFDLGGGTFDVSVLELGEGALEVLSTGGDTFLGGDDFDGLIANQLAQAVEQYTGRDPRQDSAAKLCLLALAEQAKCQLSEEESFELDLSSIAGVPMKTSIDRANFEAAIKPYLDRCLTLCQKALDEGLVHVSEIDGVVLVGGSTRIPAVRRAVTRFFRRRPDEGIDADLVVGVGAAMYAENLESPSTATSKRVLLDVTPMSLRLATVGGFCEAIIDHNSPIPTERSRLFTTARDHQDRVSLRIYQGEDDQEDSNTLLGEFVFGPFSKALRGEVQISVTFAIDSDGLVQVTARDLASGQAAVGCVNLGLAQEPVQQKQENLPAAVKR
jgi:molecular chaperone DnaK